ncbi:MULTISPECIES: hypothetical protein [Pseudomonas]|uniref:ATP-dependent DNA ligase family profile domain-containing protein n=1 Tax=Pseudomonas putida TaxID=303 RepID=A0A7D6A6N0_PSEPU|nr:MULTISPECIES: hypothetical protein [Pseudomonas]QLJ17400.1 hypothetical protein H0H12_29130 [Pseudomonas putida]
MGRLAVHSAWLDGEVVFQEDDGRPAFQALQSAFAARCTDKFVYVAFDLLYLDGADLRGEGVELSRQVLEALLEHCPLERVRFSDTLEAYPVQLLANACRMQLEGIVEKRDGRRYSSARNGAWVKLKCDNRQEFVISGFTRAATGVGSLLLRAPLYELITALLAQTAWNNWSKSAIKVPLSMNALSKGLLGLGAMPLTLLGSFAVFPVFNAPSQGNWIVAGTVAAAGALGAWFIEWTERKVVAIASSST